MHATEPYWQLETYYLGVSLQASMPRFHVRHEYMHSRHLCRGLCHHASAAPAKCRSLSSRPSVSSRFQPTQERGWCREHLLCLLLIVERAKGEASLWHPYIQYLPEIYGAPLRKFCPKDSASGCTTKPIFAAKSLNRYITVSIWIRFWHFNKVRRLPECNFGRQLIKFKALADDPLWWGEEEVALLGGTRLEIAVKQHHKIAAKLTGWRNRLVQLQRQVLRHDAAL